jgi:serine/threonine-protein kinase
MIAQKCYNCGSAISPTVQYCSKCGERVILKQKYMILRVLGQGGFGTVYLAQDLQTWQQCAIKVVSSSSITEQQQIAVEVDILTRYSPQFAFIPTIYDVWSERLQTFIAMEYIAGQTLDQMQSSAWSAGDVYHLLETLLTYLQQLHSIGIVHRDIKPSNIIRTPQGHYKLIDFGIAKQGVATRTIARGMGSIMYTSLEQFQGIPTDGRSDLYSIAATAYHLLTGRPPISADARKLGAILPKPSTLIPSTPRDLETVILAMLEVERTDRPANAPTALALLRQADKSTTKIAHSTSADLNAPTQNLTRRTRAQNRTAVVVAAIGGAATCVAAAIGLMAQVTPKPAGGASAHTTEQEPTPRPVREPTPEQQYEPEPTRTPRPTRVPPRPTDAPPEPPPPSFECPYRADASWLKVAEFWYGPYEVNDVFYRISFDTDYIYVEDSVSGLHTYPDPDVSERRNRWLNLEDTPFEVCVDGNGYVYAALNR